jgi:predicted RNase H-like HicB family nuclease
MMTTGSSLKHCKYYMLYITSTMEPIIEDIIEIIPEKSEDTETESGSEFDFDEDDEQFIHVDGDNDNVERIVDALGGLFVSSDGQTVADIYAKMAETLDKHTEALEKQNDILDKQNKVLFRLAKVIEETKK